MDFRARNLVSFQKFVFVDDVVKSQLNPVPVYKVARTFYNEHSVMTAIIAKRDFEEVVIKNDVLDAQVRIIAD